MRSSFRLGIVLTFVLSLVTVAGAIDAQSSREAEAALKAAQHQEEVLGDLVGAIEVYKRLAEIADRAVAAQALLRLAGCYEKLGRAEARATFQRILNEYADAGAIVDAARAKLAAFQGSAMPQVPANGPFASRSMDLTLYVGGNEFSPDGELLLFPRFGARGEGPPDFWIRDLDTGRERLLLPKRSGLLNRVTAFAPDGQHVAFVFTSDCGLHGRPGFRGELVVATVADGRAPTVVPFAADPYAYRPRPCLRATGQPPWPTRVAWSPDGRFLPFLAAGSDPDRAEARLLNVLTGERLSLGAEVEGDPDFQWSPDGSELAIHVTSAAARTDDIAIVSIANGRSRRVPLPAVQGRRTMLGRWTSKGEIVLRRVRVGPDRGRDVEVGLIELDTARSTVTCSGREEYVSTSLESDVCGDITFDGSTQMVWNHATQRLMARDTRTGVDRPLTLASGEEHRGFMSPDGRLAVFASNRDGRWGLYAVPITQAPVARPVLVAPLDDLPYWLAVKWTRVGLAIESRYRESNVYRVGMNRETGRSAGEIERLTQDRLENWFPVPSLDGARIVYRTRQGTKWGLAVMDADGSRERVIADSFPDSWDAPVWRADDELLLLHTLPGVGAGRQPLISYNVTSGEKKDITVLPAPVGRLWDIARTRSELVYVNGRDVNGQVVFRARSLGDGTERVMATLDGVTGSLFRFLVSPDGRQIVYLLQRKNGAGGVMELGVLQVDTGTARVLVRPDSNYWGFWPTLAGWSPDSRYVLYGIVQPRVLDTSTGEDWPLIDENAQRVPNGVDLSDGPAMFELHGRWSPDGSYLALGLLGTRRSYDVLQGVTYDAVVKLMTQTDTRGRR